MNKVFEPSRKRTKSTRRTKSGRNIVITNADKGGAVVILDVKNYEKQCERQLHNTENYKHLQKDPTATNNQLVRKVSPEKNRIRTQSNLSTNSPISYTTKNTERGKSKE